MIKQIQHMGWYQVTLRELRRMGSRRLYLLLTLVFPLISIAFFVALFSPQVPRDLPIAVYDGDQTSTSRTLLRMIDATPSVEIAFQVSDPLEGKNHIETLDAYGMVIIPEGFEKDLIRGDLPTVKSYYNNAFLVAGGLINKDITTAVRTFAAGVGYSKHVKKGEEPLQALVKVSPVRLDKHILFNPYTSYFYYLVTCFLPVMLQIFIMSTVVYAIGVELKEGTAADWLTTAQGNMVHALSGKLLPYLFIYGLLMTLTYTILFQYFHVPLNGSHLILGYNAVLFVLAYISVGILITSIFPSVRMALSISSVFGALAFTFSGLTFPYQAMYKAYVVAGQIFPFSHYLKVFNDQALKGAPLTSSFINLVALNLFLLIPFLVTGRLKRMAQDKKFWGKL
ncbi:ABC transporter permease [Thermophagus sp. OGC60D27]|uniref:ABC transporter permease n=1 Tax=Thermophagus sp. OGC60D27 TaxID=3458415 RepID=UPI004037682F